MSGNSETKTRSWSIEKGDYKRDEETTWSYFKKKQRKKNLRLFFLIVLYVIAVTAITYFLIELI